MIRRGGAGALCLAACLAVGCSDPALTPFAVCSDATVLVLDDATFDLLRDPRNCGCVGVVCAAPTTPNTVAACRDARCAVACSAGWTDCDENPFNGCETNLASDTSHCGRCRHACMSAHGRGACQGGVCALSCDDGFADCDGDPTNGCETSTRTVSNCGACGATCTLARATSTCGDGVCRVASCQGGRGDCNGIAADGCEIDLWTNALNCGACRRVCSAAGAASYCNNGACAFFCDASHGNCDSNSANGCETDTLTDLRHCGRCDAACVDSQRCVGGRCECPVGQTLCGGRCVDTRSDVNHCGACGAVCDPALGRVCGGGFCTCRAGLTDCSTRCVDLVRDNGNCGYCGRACASGDGRACVSGVCACTPGLMDCGGRCVNVQSDVLNCGACGRVCSMWSWSGIASSTCAAGACQIAACTTGRANCDGNYDSGCEVYPQQDVRNCGACGRHCPAGQACNVGACAATAALCNDEYYFYCTVSGSCWNGTIDCSTAVRCPSDSHWHACNASTTNSRWDCATMSCVPR